MKSIRIALTLACFAFAPTTILAADGEALYKKYCKKCHTLIPGKHTIGPSLAGIVGKQAGLQDYKKYKVLKNSDIIWDDANLDAWIANPKKFIGKATAMAIKVKKSADRAAIIEYMKSN